MVQKDLELLQNVLEVLACPFPERSLLLWLISCTLLICTSVWLCPALSCRLLRSLLTLSHPHCASDFIHAPGDFWLQGSAELQCACGWRHSAARCSHDFQITASREIATLSPASYCCSIILSQLDYCWDREGSWQRAEERKDKKGKYSFLGLGCALSQLWKYIGETLLF